MTLVVLVLTAVFTSASADPPPPSDAAWIDPSHCAETCVMDTTPDDPLYPQQYGPQKVHAPAAWDTTTGSPSTVIAIIDTGIDCTRPDLAPKCIAGENIITGQPIDPTTNSDDYGHGTHVASIAAAAANDSVGIAGICWQCKVMPVKNLDAQGSGTFQSMADGIRWAADHGANVINMSQGGDCDTSRCSNVEDALAYANSKGVLSVAAAGNTGGALGYPGLSSYVIGVSATDSNDNIAEFSSRGLAVDLAAPGNAVLADVPTGSCTLCDPSGYKILSGTSMASPHVSGAAGLIWAEFGGDRAQVRSRLESFADDLGTAGFDDCYGNGRLNAYRALSGTAQVDQGGAACALSTETPTPAPVITPAPSASPPATPRPGLSTNDNFASAKSISLPAQSVIDNTTATVQAGEPSGLQCEEGNGAVLADHTIWYKIKPGAKRVTLDTGDTEGVDTVIAVFSGLDLLHLNLIACNDDTSLADRSFVSWVDFRAQRNVTYYIQVGSFAGLGEPCDCSIPGIINLHVYYRGGQ